MCSDVNVESITLLHSVEGWLLFQGLRLRAQSEDMQPHNNGHAVLEADEAKRLMSLKAASPHISYSMQ